MVKGFKRFLFYYLDRKRIDFMIITFLYKKMSNKNKIAILLGKICRNSFDFCLQPGKEVKKSKAHLRAALVICYIIHT